MSERRNMEGPDRSLSLLTTARIALLLLLMFALAPGCKKATSAEDERCAQQCSTISGLPWFSALKDLHEGGFGPPDGALVLYYTDCLAACKKFPEVTECITQSRDGCDASVCVGGQDPGVCGP